MWYKIQNQDEGRGLNWVLGPWGLPLLGLGARIPSWLLDLDKRWSPRGRELLTLVVGGGWGSALPGPGREAKC